MSVMLKQLHPDLNFNLTGGPAALSQLQAGQKLD